MNNNKEIFSKIEEQYNLIKAYYNKYLKKYGVVLPKLYDKDKKITKNALVLIFLSLGYPNTRRVSKTELTKFVRKFYPSVNDVQQARHLGAQDGWYIAAGGPNAKNATEETETDGFMTTKAG